MNKIELFVEDAFREVEINDGVEELKRELVENMKERYDSLLDDGIDEIEAYHMVISNFGSVDEMVLQLKKNKKATFSKKTIFIPLIVILILVIYLANNYVNDRTKYMSNDLRSLNKVINLMSIDAKRLKAMTISDNKDKKYETVPSFFENSNGISEINKLHTSIIRDLNFIEKNRYDNNENGFYLSHLFIDLYKKIQNRYNMGLIDQVDIEVANLYALMSEELVAVLDNENYRISGYNGKNSSDFRAMFATLDVDGIIERYKGLNALALSYVKYHNLQNDITLLSKEEIETKIAKFIDEEEYEVKWPSYGIGNSIYTDGIYENIRVKLDYLDYHFTYDGVNGDLKNIEASFWRLPENLVEYDLSNKLLSFKRLLFENGLGVDFIDKGINYKMISDYEYRSYEMKVSYNGYSVFPMERNMLYLSKDGSNVYSVSLNNLPTRVELVGNTKEVYNKDNALSFGIDKYSSIIEVNYPNIEIDKELCNYKSTQLVYSKNTNRFDLMHLYEISPSDKLLIIRADNGYIEAIK